MVLFLGDPHFLRKIRRESSLSKMKNPEGNFSEKYGCTHSFFFFFKEMSILTEKPEWFKYTSVQITDSNWNMGMYFLLIILQNP